MPRYHTNTTAIRKYKSEYYGLMVHEARLNHELFRMAQRIKAIQKDEAQSLADQTLLTKLLAHATQQKAELEAQPISKDRNKQLKKAEKEYKEVNAKHKRNEYHLAVLEKKKDKDNAAKYILKEMKRDEVHIRIKTAYDIWKRLEQEEQYEFMDFEMFKALHFVKQAEQAATQTTTNTQSDQALEKNLSVAGIKPFIHEKSPRVIINAYSNRFQTHLTVTNPDKGVRIVSIALPQKQFTYSIQKEMKTEGLQSDLFMYFNNSISLEKF